MNVLMEILAGVLSYCNAVLTGKAVVDEIKQEYEPEAENTIDKS